MYSSNTYNINDCAEYVVQGTTFSLPPLNYLFMHTRESNAFCIGVFNNGGSGTLLGGITFRDTLIQVSAPSA